MTSKGGFLLTIKIFKMKQFIFILLTTVLLLSCTSKSRERFIQQQLKADSLEMLQVQKVEEIKKVEPVTFKVIDDTFTVKAEYRNEAIIYMLYADNESTQIFVHHSVAQELFLYSSDEEALEYIIEYLLNQYYINHPVPFKFNVLK